MRFRAETAKDPKKKTRKRQKRKRKKKRKGEDSGTHVPQSEIPPGNYTVCHGNSLAIGPGCVLN